MTKRLATLLLVQLFWVSLVSGQCDFSNPYKGLTIDNATFLCGSTLDGYTGRLPNSISPGNQPDEPCNNGGTVENIVWFSFIPTSFNVRLSISYFNCTVVNNLIGIQAGIYEDLQFQNPVGCYMDTGSSPTTVTANGLTPGQVYYLFIDGVGGSSCDYRISVISGVSNLPMTFDWKDDNNKVKAIDGINELEDLHNVCVGMNPFSYEAPVCQALVGARRVDNLEEYGLYCYEWNIDPPLGGVITSDPNSKNITVDWQAPGDYTINVTVIAHPDLLACAAGFCENPAPIRVLVGEFNDVVNDTIYVCADQPILYCGELINTTTTVECVDDLSTCSRTIQPFKLLEFDTIFLPTIVQCGSDCFELFGFDYCDPGDYVISDGIECEKRYAFSIEGFYIDIDLPATYTLDCDNDEQMVIPEFTTNYTGNIVTRWEENGTIITDNDTLIVSFPGIFTYFISFPDLGNNCGGSQQINIRESVDAPDFNLIIPQLNCTDPTVDLNFVAIDPIDSIAWSNASGFISNDISISVAQEGMYRIFVKGQNGCVSDSTFTVEKSDEQPLITLDYDNLNCVTRSSLAQFTADRPVAEVTWLLPDNSTSTVEDLIIDAPGNYQLSVTSTNGCETIVPFTVMENIVTPLVNAGEDQMWQCNTQVLNINAEVNAGPHDIQWSFIEIGNILSNSKMKEIDVGSPGLYVINVRNTESGCNARDSVSVILNDNVPEIVETFITEPSCFSESDGIIQINEISGGTAPYKIYLDGQLMPDNVTFIDDLTAGSYTLLLMDSYDCELTLPIEVVEPEEIIIENPINIEIGFNTSENISITHNVPLEDVLSIFWYDEQNAVIGSGDEISITGMENTTLTVRLTHENGCIAERTINVTIDFSLPIFSPNVFSPNNDGINDVFTLYANEAAGYMQTFSIYNRWGEIIYSVNDLEFNDESRGWNGTKNGESLDPAVYTYMAKIILPDGNDKIVSGDITLIK